MGLVVLLGWLAAALAAVVGLQALVLLQTRRYARQSALRDRSSGRKLQRLQQQLKVLSRRARTIQDSQRSMARDSSKSVERLDMLKADLRPRIVTAEEQVESIVSATRSGLRVEHEQIHNKINLLAAAHATAPIPPLRG